MPFSITTNKNTRVIGLLSYSTILLVETYVGSFVQIVAVPLVFSMFQLDGAQKDIDKEDEPDFYEEAPLPG